MDHQLMASKFVYLQQIIWLNETIQIIQIIVKK